VLAALEQINAADIDAGSMPRCRKPAWHKLRMGRKNSASALQHADQRSVNRWSPPMRFEIAGFNFHDI
jgi:hypothetical protein